MRFVVTGTDTGIGKTVFSAGLAGALHARYWKPVQSGLAGETDSDCVRRLAGLPADFILTEAYRLSLPASPHTAAAREGAGGRATDGSGRAGRGGESGSARRTYLSGARP